MNIMTNKVLEIVNNELDAQVELSQDLFDSGLDSLGVLRLLAMLEDEFSIEIPDEELILVNFQNVENLVAMVCKYVQN